MRLFNLRKDFVLYAGRFNHAVNARFDDALGQLLVRGDEQGLFVINALRQEEVKRAFSEVSKWTKEGTVKKEYVSEVACHDGGFTLFGEGDGVEIILGKEDYQQRLKRALAILNDAKKRGLLIRCIDARFEKGAIIQERKG